MNRFQVLLGPILIIVIILTASCSHELSLREKRNFDDHWRFFLLPSDTMKIDQIPRSEWRTLHLPHDWSIEGEYSRDHGTDWQSGFLPGGVAYYQKDFNWENEWDNKKVMILFDGVYVNSHVWINGEKLGFRPNGYVSFQYDLTPYLEKGNNTITVQVDHSKPQSGRWYTGSGIYRHVWIVVHEKAYIPSGEVFFRTPQVNDRFADYEVETVIRNEKDTDLDLRLVTSLHAPGGDEVSVTETNVHVKQAESSRVHQSGQLEKPMLWSPGTPDHYILKSKLLHDDELVDEMETIVGFRKIEVDASKGLFLNGIPIKLKGVCDHHTAGAVGAAIPDDVLYRRLKLLKEMGCNAIRTAHNPYSPVFYDMCDTMGFMVLNEAFDGWDEPKAPDDYGHYFEDWWETDLVSFVKRDRNHPSVVFWSLGNEVWTGTRETQTELLETIREHDPTRLVTQGGIDPTRGMTDDYSEKFLLDIKGFNGKGEEKHALSDFHEQFPDIPIVGTEIPHTYQTRGVYRSKTHYRRRDFPAPWEVWSKRAGNMDGLDDKIYAIDDLTETEFFKDEVSEQYFKDGSYYPIENEAPWAPTLYYQSSYDNAVVRIAARKQWQIVDSLPYVIGQFRWGSFDYLGESNLWPSRCANFGVIDLCGFPKDHFYLYQSLWTSEPMVHILPHWTHTGREGEAVPVVVYTNCDSVCIELNDRSLGTQTYLGEQLSWHVPYEPGTLKALAYSNGKVEATEIARTAGQPEAIQLLPDKKQLTSGERRVIHFEVSILDQNGVMVPSAEHEVTFMVEGPGRILGTDNGDPLDLSGYKTNRRKAFRGKCLLMVETDGSTGNLVISAESTGLKSSKEIIKVRK